MADMGAGLRMMLRRILAGLCLALLLAMPAEAQTVRRLLLLSGTPGWVKPGAKVDMDFANGRYFGCTLTSCLSLTRASNKTNLLPSSPSGFTYTTFGNGIPAIDSIGGWLIEETRTNQLFNSTAPATQTTGSLGTATYTLWVNGSGSATMSAGTGTGCGTGAATNGTPVNFTITVAGTCTVTVAGSLNAFQIEQGPGGSSLIVTAGATATRAADNISITGALASVLLASTGSLLAATQNSVPNGNATVIGRVSGANATPMYFSGGTQLSSYSGSVVLSDGSVTAINSNKSGLTWNASGRSLVTNNGTVSSDANALVMPPSSFLGNELSSHYYNGYVSRLTVFSSRLSDATIKAFTQ